MIEKIKRMLHRGALFVLHGVPRITIEAKVLQVHTSELLKSHVVLITGGSSGIGKAIAKACLESGAKVIITGRNKEKLSSSVSKLREISTAVYALPLDNNDVKNMKDAIIEAEKLAGAKLTTLINNAGIALGSFDHLEEEEFDKVLDTNIKGTVFLSKYFSEYLRQNDIKGNILNNFENVLKHIYDITPILSSDDEDINKISFPEVLENFENRKEKVDLALENSKFLYINI